VSVFERDLERVLTDESYVLDPQLIRFEILEAGQTSGHSSLAATLSTRACPPKPLARVGAAMPTLPRDDHDLAFAIDVDCEGKRVGIFQGRAYRTLMTGSCRND
jgi:hypothetical protein